MLGSAGARLVGVSVLIDQLAEGPTRHALEPVIGVLRADELPWCDC
jgi:hypothetical protein